MATIPGVKYQLIGGSWRSPGRQNVAPGDPPLAVGPKLRVNGVRMTGSPVVAPVNPADWSDSNPPWAWTGTVPDTSDWPVGTFFADLQTGSSDFWTNVSNTVAAAGRRVVINADPGVYHLKSFRLAGSSGDQSFSYGLWFSNLQGFKTNGPGLIKIQMDANSMSTAQLTRLSGMTLAGFNPNQMAMCRFDGNPSSPVLLSGVQFQAADQQMLTTIGADVAASGVKVPQPAPHQGVVIYLLTTSTVSASLISNCRFIGAGRAMNSQPPFEHANLSTAKGQHYIRDFEMDGRRDASIDPARPRRCSTVMANNELVHHLTDGWLHHSNVSRYAVNDQNAATTGDYSVLRVKIEHITETQNVDPALNGGASLGGYTNASNFGWESCGGTIDVSDSIIEVDNPNASGQFPAHFQFTVPSGTSANPRGGRLHAKGNTYKNPATPHLDGYCTVRLGTASYWWTDGAATTLDIRRADNVALIGYNVTGSWPPSLASLAAAGVSPNTHYLYKGV